MAEKEYIDKVKFNYAISEAVKKYPNSFYNGLEVARQIAHDFPAADVREVVLCEDCKYYNTAGCSDGYGWCEDSVVSTGVSDNFFCARADMRKES